MVNEQQRNSQIEQFFDSSIRLPLHDVTFFLQPHCSAPSEVIVANFFGQLKVPQPPCKCFKNIALKFNIGLVELNRYQLRC